MNQDPDASVVSAFGRGNWLAAELVEQGLKVALVDVSSQLGRWTPEDWEGPFGLYRSENLTPLQIARLHEEDYEDEISEGFCLWLEGGPIDFTGPISPFLLERSGLSQECIDYVATYDSLSDEGRRKLIKDLDKQPYSKKWLAYLSHGMGSPMHRVNTETLTYGRPLPLFSQYAIRRVSRRGQQRSLDWLRERGVDVYEGASLQDLSEENLVCKGLEVRSQGTSRLQADRYLWMLTSEETSRFSRVSQALFPAGPVEPDWVWIRYRIQLKETEMMKSLPDKFVMIKEIELEWVHENLCLVQKSDSPLHWDVWMKIPNQHRFRRAYLQELSEKMIALFGQRLPGCAPTVLDMPQDYHYDESEIGPSRFPVYSEEKLKQLNRRRFKNIEFDSPENWQLLDWTGQFLSQQKLCKSVVKDFQKNRSEESLDD